MQVVVQSHQAPGDAVAPVGLDHFPSAGEPLATVGFDEVAPLIAVDAGLHQPHTGDRVGFGDVCHDMRFYHAHGP